MSQTGVYGAASRRQGCFELADTGTLLLDEIGEMPALLQAKLLRVIEERAVRRLGSRKEIEVDVRLLAATNRQPHQAVSEGKLRSDLLYRLNVFGIHLPSLCRGGTASLFAEGHHWLWRGDAGRPVLDDGP